jgi:hypothetical protein
MFIAAFSHEGPPFQTITFHEKAGSYFSHASHVTFSRTFPLAAIAIAIAAADML